MKCKAGDLAIIIRTATGQYVGWIVEVVKRAPEGEFRLPDGQACHSYGADWIIHSCGSFFEHKYAGLNISKRTPYATIDDSCLRPIRPGELDNETQDNRELESV